MKHPRIAISALTLSAASLIGLAVSEGYSDRAIIPTKGDVPTIGFGTTTRPDGSPVQMGDRTNPVEALQRKQRDLVKFEGALKQCVRVPLHQRLSPDPALGPIQGPAPARPDHPPPV